MSIQRRAPSTERTNPLQRTISTTRVGLVILIAFSLAALAAGFALGADDSKVKNATNQVESGAKKIPDGKVGEGVEETAKTAWGDGRAAAVGFGHTVRGFFANLFAK